MFYVCQQIESFLNQNVISFKKLPYQAFTRAYGYEVFTYGDENRETVNISLKKKEESKTQVIRGVNTIDNFLPRFP